MVVSHAHVQLRILTPQARLEALLKALNRYRSQTFASFAPRFLRVYPQPFNLFDTFFISFEIVLLVVGGVAIRLVHTNATLFLSQ